MDSADRSQAHLEEFQLRNLRTATDALQSTFADSTWTLQDGSARRLAVEKPLGEKLYWRAHVPISDGSGIGQLVISCGETKNNGPIVDVRSHSQSRGADLQLAEIQDAFVRLAKMLPLDVTVRTGPERRVAETAAWLGARLSVEDAARLGALTQLLMDPRFGPDAAKGIATLAAKAQNVRGVGQLTTAPDFMVSYSRSGWSLPNFIGQASRALHDVVRTTDLTKLSAQKLLDLTVDVSGVSLRVGEELFWRPAKVFEVVDDHAKLLVARVEPSLRITARELLASPNADIRMRPVESPRADGISTSSRHVGVRRTHRATRGG